MHRASHPGTCRDATAGVRWTAELSQQHRAAPQDWNSAPQEPAKRSDSAAAAAPVEDADDLELARSLAQTQHSGGADARADDDAAAGEQAADGAGAEAERLRQMRAEVLAAFNRDEEDEDDDDDVEETTPAAKSPARRRRRRPSQDGAHMPPCLCRRICANPARAASA